MSFNKTINFLMTSGIQNTKFLILELSVHFKGHVICNKEHNIINHNYIKQF